MFITLYAILSSALVVIAAPQVQIGNTTLIGRDVTLLHQEFFGGIPFAKPPVGNLRLKPPVPQSTIDAETFDASNFGPACLQPPSSLVALNLSEDCLTVNVFRPANISTNASLPVLFWTYGGGFQGGAASIFNASAIVAQSVARGTPLIYVSHNYRLGPLGFPQGQEAAKRKALNLALMDQLAALQWVQDNIAFFGGDPSKVTVFGESAGAIMLAEQFLHPTFSKFARAAIFESGSAATHLLFNSEKRQGEWDNFVANVPECASLAQTNNTFDCLQTANTSDILQGLVSAIAEAPEVFSFCPTIDGPGGFIPELPSSLLRKGRFTRIPFIAGTNVDEGTAFTPPAVNYTSELIAQLIASNFTPPVAGVSIEELEESIRILLELYPEDPAFGSPFNTGNETFGLSPGYKRTAALDGDIAFQSQRRLLIQAASNAGVKTFGYLFTQPQPQNPSFLGVTHGSEVVYVYGAVQNRTASDIKISSLMIDYWVSFATSLDPNDGRGLPRPTWAQYTPENRVLMQLNGDNTTLIPDDYRREQIEFINSDPAVFHHRRSY